MDVVRSAGSRASGGSAGHRRALSGLLLAGSALGWSLLPSAAAAQSIRQSAPDGSPITIESGDIVVDDGTAIYAETTGRIAIDSRSIVTTAPGGYGINARGGTGTVSIDSGSVTTTGPGQVYGISAITSGGAIAINSGTVNVAGRGADDSRGIHANSGGGDITIDAGTTVGHTRAIFTTTLFAGPELGFVAGNTRITSQSATATGGNAIIAQGYSVNLTSGRAEATANPGYSAATIYVSAGRGGAAIRAGETIGNGYGVHGLQVLSTGALTIGSGSIVTDGAFSNGILAAGASAITIDSGSIRTAGQNSHGIQVDGYTAYTADPIRITSDAITTAGNGANGIYVSTFDGTSGVTGDITVDSGRVETSGALAHGIVVGGSPNPTYQYRPVSPTAGTGALTIVSDTIVATGAGARGIIVDHAGAIALTSGSIVTQGSGIYMWAGSTVDITSGSVSTQEGPGIVVYGAAGNVRIDAGSTEVGAAGDVGIFVETGAGDIAITADRTVTNGIRPASGYTADGITALSTGGGDISIDSGLVSVKGEAAFGIYASTAGTARIVSDEVATTGIQGTGIWAAGSAGLTIDSGSILTSGDAALGIRARSANGDIAITSDSIRTAGAGATGIFVPTRVGNGPVMGGNITIDSGTIATSGAGAYGIVVGSVANPAYGMRPAQGGTGALSIVSDSIIATGPDSWGIAVDHSGPIRIVSGSITTGADGGGAGIYAWAGGTVDITSGSITTPNGPGIVVYGGAGNVNIDAGTTSVGTGGDVGVWARTTTGDINIRAGTTTTTLPGLLAGQFTGDGVTGISASGGRVAIDAGITSVIGTSAWGVTALTTGAASIVSGKVTTAGSDGIGIYGRGDTGGVAIASGDVTTSGARAHGIQALATTGNVQVTSTGTIATAGNGAAGIVARSTTGAIDVAVNRIDVSGDGANAIDLASSAGGAITLDIGGVVTASNAGGYAGALLSGSGALSVRIGAAGGINSGGRGLVLLGSGTIDNGGMIVSAGRSIEAEAVQIANRGTIRSNGGVAIYAAAGGTVTNTGTIHAAEAAIVGRGAMVLDNSGRIESVQGLAVSLSSADDRLILRTGSTIVGGVDGGAGFDAVTLIGSSAQPTAAQVIGRLTNFEALTVERGYWTTDRFVGAFDRVAIAADGALQVNEVLGTDGDSAIVTGDVRNDGLLVLNFASDVLLDSSNALAVSGSGALLLAGTGTIQVDTDTLTHTGGTIVANGALHLTGSLAGDVTTTGNGIFALGDGGTRGDFTGNLVNDGTFIFARSDNYSFLGDFSGSGLLEKRGAGVLTFAGAYEFSGTTRVLGGSVKLTGTIDPETDFDVGQGLLDLSGTNQTIGGLSGGAQGSVNIAGAQLTIDQDEASVFAGSITGNGSLRLTGGGQLNLTGNSSYTGTTSIDNGTLKVNGSIVSPVLLNAGGVLGGNGRVGSVTVAGGRIGPGNSIGRLTVNGNLAFNAGSVYEVEANAAGAADRIDVTGATTIASTARVQVLAESGSYRPRTLYTILTSAGGITGTFGSVTSNLAFLTPQLRYSANEVTLALYRNDVEFAAVADGGNQTSVARAVQALGIGNAVYEEVLTQSAAMAQSSYDALSGEIYATTASVLTHDARMVRDALIAAMPDESVSGGFAIGSTTTNWGTVDARGDAAAADLDYSNLIVGAGYAEQGISVALAGTVTKSRQDVDARASSATATGWGVAGVVGYVSSGFRAQAGASFAWHEVDITRAVNFGAGTATQRGQRDATSRQLFGNLAYDVVEGELDLAPFVRLASVRITGEALAEAGNAAALSVARNVQETTFVTLGADARLPLGGGAEVTLGGGWQHGWGDLAGTTQNRLRGGTTAIQVTGARLPEDAAVVDLGLQAQAGPVRIGASYTGSFASGWQDHGARATISIAL
ncbi:autotransporter-associated beta strand repeat-containing protein [Sphingomonas turrisvirgatae]|uniref:Autotransporter domain-containing protein n=1 Tax=Sphingomonas turrisvirgatae TaxID=1888892 RepID=A0A1E3LTQ3_9SPHN|nr:autotransporter-associated beta strand repeat-containing protein [Sphingomonas turrisvirgatae]ODP37152.1 hypothetical protein BFL28_02640 [Sphingomonas turrisvirgatae]